jgi:hypothetical protein
VSIKAPHTLSILRWSFLDICAIPSAVTVDESSRNSRRDKPMASGFDLSCKQVGNYDRMTRNEEVSLLNIRVNSKYFVWSAVLCRIAYLHECVLE